MTLDRLGPQHSAAIAAVEATGMAGERMAALGLLPGRQVVLLRRAPFGGPLHLRIGPTELMIRRADARAVLLEQVQRWLPAKMR
ncbi:MAG TPA: FeoA family protein [Casimicrobiaceae bacterium]|nr:FeoA family protein [Casimicrobiaceae bacterium]